MEGLGNTAPFLRPRLAGQARTPERSIATSDTLKPTSITLSDETGPGNPAGDYSMTSSARTKTAFGKARPRARAAFWLTTNSNRVGWSMGRSEALAPRTSLAA